MTSRRVLLSALMPLVVLAGWVVRLEIKRQQGREVELNVRAYDPRDLLAGHYLQYTVDYGESICGEGYDNRSDVCVCLNDVPAPATASWSGDCSSRPDECEVFIAGRCDPGRFAAGIERYYIPEAYTSQLTQVPPDSTIRVRVATDGSALVQQFLVGGVPLAQYLADPSTRRPK
jgi:uncharacterized membrane-anchored protein